MVKPLIAPKERECACGCGRKFVPYRPQNIYFSDKCQETVYNREHDIAGQLKKMRAKRAKRKKE